ncbi:hypothetical protein HPB47_025316 [Ixodes persulcatus]|uniref:Uncharacterized protein n=1 Tax=Ixodes persulcatus TaxID=34615 RepID=A0AC60Q3R1_IXOPE|nr:hypothetical protein HPB47_025316 [Ixodes persulcatus]
MSRLAYVVPFMRIGVAEKFKLECIVRKAYKRALGLPDSTSNEKLAALGVHNTIDELIEAQGTAQLKRLTRSATGRHILKNLGLRYETQRGEKVDAPLHIREMLQISPIPKHMHPVCDAKRREARAKALGRTLQEEEGVAYVDAAEYKGRRAMVAAVVNGDGHLVASCSVKTDDPETTEVMAVALALSMPGVRTIVCDSQSAVHNFAKGSVAEDSARPQGNLTQTTLTLKGRSTSSRKAREPALANRKDGPTVAIGQRRPSRLPRGSGGALKSRQPVGADGLGQGPSEHRCALLGLSAELAWTGGLASRETHPELAQNLSVVGLGPRGFASVLRTLTRSVLAQYNSQLRTSIEDSELSLRQTRRGSNRRRVSALGRLDVVDFAVRPVAVPEPRATRPVPGGGGTGQRSNQSGRPASGNQSPSDAAGASPGATAD